MQVRSVDVRTVGLFLQDFSDTFHVGTYLLGISQQEIILISVTYMVLEISCVRVFGFLHYSGWSLVDLHAQPGRSISWLPPPQSSPPGAVVHVRLIWCVIGYPSLPGVTPVREMASGMDRLP